MLRIYKKAKLPTQNPWCDICTKGDCDKIITGFSTCDIIRRFSALLYAVTDLRQQIISVDGTSQLDMTKIKSALENYDK